MSQCEAAVFDFNGTLVWDNACHEEAWITFAREFGKTIDHASYYRTMHGHTTAAIFTELLGHEATDEEVARLSREKERIYREICLRQPGRYIFAPGVEDLLNELSGLGVPMNIATASEIDNVEFFIRHFGLERWFETERIVYDDGTIPNKPAPDIYLKAARMIGTTPDRCLIVEDSRSGVKAARDAGCRHIIVAGEKTEQHERFRSMDEISQIISDFSEIDRSIFSLK